MKSLSDNIKPVLALMIISFTFGIYTVVTLNNIKMDADIKSFLNTITVLAIGYYFGASTGGAKKDETINNLIDKQK